MTFDEITYDAVNKAFHNLREIDTNLVNAQFSRQMLDKIIGFLISGILQKATGLMSAGRVQTPALKLLVDRDKEIKLFQEVKYRKINVVEQTKGINLALTKDEKGILINNPDTYYLIPPLDNTIINQLTTTYQCVDYKASEYETRSFKPYSTVGLLQDGFTKLHLSAQQITIAAQKLYENGLVTYIRTDSQRYSDDFLDEAMKYIQTNYGPELFAQPLKPRANQKVNVQDAHESIRPTNLETLP
jgi:DNA topoisomerase-1